MAEGSSKTIGGTGKRRRHYSHNGRMLHDELAAFFTPHRFLVAYDGFEVEF